MLHDMISPHCVAGAGHLPKRPRIAKDRQGYVKTQAQPVATLQRFLETPTDAQRYTTSSEVYCTIKIIS